MNKSRITRRLLLTGSSIAAVASSVPAQARPSLSDPLSALWQGLTLLDVNGAEFHIGDVHASLALIKLWANWCSICLSETVSLKSLMVAMGPRDLHIIMISHPEYWSRDQQVARSRALPFRLATPSAGNGPAVIQAALTEQNGAYAVPRSLLFNEAKDAVVWTSRGAKDWTSPGVMTQLRGQLG